MVIGDYYNWRALPRALWIIRNPLRFLWGLVWWRTPSRLSLRTPTGTVWLHLRNFESLKTLYSLFCREDYKTAASRPFFFIDIGANIGLASVYFLSRNKDNHVICFEPDVANLAYLRKNVEAFAGRAIVVDAAVAAQAGQVVLYQSADGKHSSLIASPVALAPRPVFAACFADVLGRSAGETHPTVVKLDVEGSEPELLNSVSFTDYPRVARLIYDSIGIAHLVSRPHHLIRRSGFVEDLYFSPETTTEPAA